MAIRCAYTYPDGRNCGGYVATSVNNKYCMGHVNKLNPEERKRRTIENNKDRVEEYKKGPGRPRKDGKKFKGVAQEKADTKERIKDLREPREILSKKNFNLAIEIQLADENSEFSKSNLNDPIEEKLMNMKLFAMWLNADDITREPQETTKVARLLDVSMNKLTYWRQGVTLRKIMTEQLDNAMKYDARKIAYKGLLDLLNNGDAKAVDRYMQMFVEKPRTEQNDIDEQWTLDKIDELPDDAPAERKDNMINSVNKDIALKLMVKE